jgi:hypothetical protein
MRRGLSEKRVGPNAAKGQLAITPVLFGDVRAGRAAARSVVLGPSALLAKASRLTGRNYEQLLFVGRD